MNKGASESEQMPQMKLVPNDSSPVKCSLFLTGYVHAYSLSVKQLVQVLGAGDFQLSKIVVMKDPFPWSGRKDHAVMDSYDINDVISSIVLDPLEQESFIFVNVPDVGIIDDTNEDNPEMDEEEDIDATIRVYTLLGLSGEQVDHGVENCSVVVKVASKQCKVGLWTKNAGRNWWILWKTEDIMPRYSTIQASGQG